MTESTWPVEKQVIVFSATFKDAIEVLKEVSQWDPDAEICTESEYWDSNLHAMQAWRASKEAK